MRKETLVASADGNTTIKRERRMPGPTPRPRATCAYAGCDQLVKLNATYCSISHSKLGKPHKASDTAPPAPKTKKKRGLVTTLDDHPSSLIASIEE